MTATNHILSGGLIGALLPLPVAIPVAFVSHFVLDAIPHYSVKSSHRAQSRTYKDVIIADTILSLALSITVLVFAKWNMFIGGFVAFAPDITLIHYYFKHGRDLQIKGENALTRFHINIQRLERPWGIAVEVAAIAIMLPFFIQQLLKT